MASNQKLIENKADTAGSIKPKWHFPLQKLKSCTPSRHVGFTYEAELQQLQRSCAFIRELADRYKRTKEGGERLSNLCITVAMIRLRRFFLIHNLADFDPLDVGTACLFLSSKTEECPCRLEFLTLLYYRLRVELECPEDEWDATSIISKTQHKKFCDYIAWSESIILQTCGFGLEVNVPHPVVINLCTMLKLGEPMPKLAYWLATDVHHNTDWIVRFRPKTIACVVLYVASLYANEKLPNSPHGTPWFEGQQDPADEPLNEKLLLELAAEYAKALNVAKSFGVLASQAPNPNDISIK
ncbi:Cyclin-T [Aphelenchoides fujianensis]|nr:Cyclin-T [Aphelenchoides fujianensis]